MASSKKKSKPPAGTMAARKARNKSKQAAAPINTSSDGDVTEEESIHEDAEMEDADIPDTIHNGNDAEEENEEINPKARAKKTPTKTQNREPIPFMDTFYQLSSDEPKLRSLAARDLITHCFLSPDGINATDAAYALTRLLNGLCTGRAASRQGFASALSTFLRVAHSTDELASILDADSFAREIIAEKDTDIVFRLKLLASTQFQQSEKDAKKQGGKMKGMEERDHAFGRLFGILAVVRSGVLGLKDFPSEVTEGYITDVIDLYNYKNWIREPAANAIIELLSTLDSAAVVKVTNHVIVPKFLENESVANDQWVQNLNAEQIAVAVHAQRLGSELSKFSSPLNQAILTGENVKHFCKALNATSTVVYPRCHIVWNVMWLSLTEEVDGHRQLCKAKGSYTENSSIIENLINHVVVDSLLGKGESSGSPSNERKSLALQIVSTLAGASNLNIALPTDLIGTVLCPDVVERVFLNVLCASGGVGAKRSKAADSKDGTVQHHLKSLTTTILSDIVARVSDKDFVYRRLAFVKAFVSAEPRFDVRTKTQTVSTLLMMNNDNKGLADDQKAHQEQLWDVYLSFLEEAIITADSLHKATVYVELMFKLAKRDLAKAPANVARRVIRFFMTAAFFDCSNVSSPSTNQQTSSKKKKGKKASNKVDESSAAPPELSSALRIKDILQSSNMDGILSPSRAIMSSRFYSLLSDFVSTVNSQSRGGNKSKPFYGNASKPESVYRALSEISGIASVLDLSGAKQYHTEVHEGSSEDESPAELSRKHMLDVKKIADDALVNECAGSDDTEALRAKSVFTTGCASLMISLHLQLSSVEEIKEDDEDDAEENKEAVHEFIADLSEVVSDFSRVLEGKSSGENEAENPLTAMASLLVNVLSSSIGGEDSGQNNASMASASKLTRETVKLAWSGVLSLMTSLYTNTAKTLVDEDFMNTLIESVCGPAHAKDETGDDESIEESEEDQSENEDGVFSRANNMDVDLENEQDADSSNKSDDGGETSEEEDIELDPSRLENMLLEDSDAEIDVLEHHAGADKALAQLIKMRQDTRKASQSERERVELCNRLRCASLLDSLFSASVFKSGWLSLEAVLGSSLPILRSYKSIAKSIDKSSSATLASKSLNEKKALMDRLSSLIQEKLSKFRRNDSNDSNEESILRVVTDISQEMNHSLNLAHCSMCSVALITSIRCLTDAESNTKVAEMYCAAVKDWMSRKATKIHTCVFDDLIQRLPSLAASVLVVPLIEAAQSAHSGYLRCESLRLLSHFYRASGKEDEPSEKVRETLTGSCSNVAHVLKDSLCDVSLQKSKNKDEILNAVKHFASYANSHASTIAASDLIELKDALKSAGDATKSVGTKNICLKLAEDLSEISQKAVRVADPNPKSSTKKKKKSKK